MTPGVGGGNLVGPDHPMFAGRYPDNNSIAYPPGSRFDPFGPGGGPRGPFPRGPPRGGFGSVDIYILYVYIYYVYIYYV